jgi:hypothetical protein
MSLQLAVNLGWDGQYNQCHIGPDMDLTVVLRVMGDCNRERPKSIVCSIDYDPTVVTAIEVLKHLQTDTWDLNYTIGANSVEITTSGEMPLAGYSMANVAQIRFHVVGDAGASAFTPLQFGRGSINGVEVPCCPITVTVEDAEYTTGFDPVIELPKGTTIVVPYSLSGKSGVNPTQRFPHFGWRLGLDINEKVAEVVKIEPAAQIPAEYLPPVYNQFVKNPRGGRIVANVEYRTNKLPGSTPLPPLEVPLGPLFNVTLRGVGAVGRSTALNVDQGGIMPFHLWLPCLWRDSLVTIV